MLKVSIYFPFLLTQVSKLIKNHSEISIVTNHLLRQAWISFVSAKIRQARGLWLKDLMTRKP